MPAPGLFDVTSDGCVLRVHVVPGADREGVIGRHGDALKIRVRAPAREGAANAAVAAFVAATFGVPKSGVEIVSGHRSRSKRLAIPLDAAALERTLDQVLDAARQRRPKSS